MKEENNIPVQFLYFVDSGLLEHITNCENAIGIAVSDNVDVWQDGAVLNIKQRSEE